MRAVAGRLRLELAQYRELQVFAQFSSDMDAATRDTLNYGGILTELLVQKDGEPMPMWSQVALLYVVTHTLIPHDAPLSLIRRLKAELPRALMMRSPEIASEFERAGELTPEFERAITGAAHEWLAGAEAQK
jgi:F-type H+-transporting ATPase subunit alpha